MKSQLISYVFYPASQPPLKNKMILIELEDGNVLVGTYENDTYWSQEDWHVDMVSPAKNWAYIKLPDNI